MLHLPDAAIEVNAPTIIAGIISHPLATRLSVPTISRLVELAERHPPRLNRTEAKFLRLAIATVEFAEIEATERAYRGFREPAK